MLKFPGSPLSAGTCSKFFLTFVKPYYFHLMTKRYLFAVFFGLVFFIFSIYEKALSVGWTANPFEHRVFIENKGQLDEKEITKNETGAANVKYFVESEGVVIYFTANGLMYRHDEVL